MARVMIVDDEAALRKTIQAFVERDGHSAVTAGDATQALQVLETNEVDVVVSDIVMPRLSGVALLVRLKHSAPHAKVILITGEPSIDSAAEAVRHGAFDYLAKPVSRKTLCKVVRDAARFKALEDENRRYQEGLEDLVRARTEKLRQTVEATVTALASAMEMRDPYTAGHQRRVAKLACAIAEEMGMGEDQREGLRLAGLLHDIGKLHIPAEILAKPTHLSQAEFSLVREHAGAGFDILNQIDFQWPLADIVHQHHERSDGTGYPLGIPGDEILQEARILAVADVVEAMASHRPYRPALGIETALAEIRDKRGVLFDPEVVNACQAVCNRDNNCFGDS